MPLHEQPLTYGISVQGVSPEAQSHDWKEDYALTVYLTGIAELIDSIYGRLPKVTTEEVYYHDSPVGFATPVSRREAAQKTLSGLPSSQLDRVHGTTVVREEDLRVLSKLSMNVLLVADSTCVGSPSYKSLSDATVELLQLLSPKGKGNSAVVKELSGIITSALGEHAVEIQQVDADSMLVTRPLSGGERIHRALDVTQGKNRFWNTIVNELLDQNPPEFLPSSLPDEIRTFLAASKPFVFDEKGRICEARLNLIVLPEYLLPHFTRQKDGFHWISEAEQKLFYKKWGWAVSLQVVCGSDVGPVFLCWLPAEGAK